MCLIENFLPSQPSFKAILCTSSFILIGSWGFRGFKVNDKLELSVKIKEMDENEKQGALDFVLPHWVDTSS